MAKAQKQDQEAKIVGYKGFDKDLCCRGFQFEIGKTYKVEGKITACENGFHACTNPFDVWSYYEIMDSNAKLNRFAIVEQSGDIGRHADDSKVASAEITIKAELKLPEFVKAAVQWIIDATKDKSENSSGDFARIGSSGDFARIGSSGYSARIGSSGDSAQIGSSGHFAQIGSSGYSARIGSSGDFARIGSSGYSARIGSSGDFARIGSSGHSAQIGSSGDFARIGSSGHSARIVSEGNKAVIACAGSATVSAKMGSWISLAEFDERGECIGFASGCVGKDGLKPDTAYIAKGGRLVEVK